MNGGILRSRRVNQGRLGKGRETFKTWSNRRVFKINRVEKQKNKEILGGAGEGT